MTKEQADALEDVAKRIFGPRDDRTRDAATYTKSTGEYTGGTTFERHIRAIPVKDDTRAYPIGPTHQVQLNLNAPAMMGKCGPKLDDHLKMRQDICKVCRTAHRLRLFYELITLRNR